MIEQGLDYEVPYWTAIYAPAVTPRPVVEKLAAEIAKTMKDAEVVGIAEGMPAPRRSARPPPRWTSFNRQQFELYRKIVQIRI